MANWYGGLTHGMMEGMFAFFKWKSPRTGSFFCLLFAIVFLLNLSGAAAAPPLKRDVLEDGKVVYRADSGHNSSPPSLPYKRQDIREALFFAGDPGHGKKHLLRGLFNSAKEMRAKSRVIFPGDLIYTHGMPGLTSPRRDQAETKLNNILFESNASGVFTAFVPGNHDWNNMKDRGWQAVLRLNAYLEGFYGENRLYPQNACPGPTLIPSSSKVALVALDTQWWLHRYDKPGEYSKHCRGNSEALSTMEKLKRMLHSSKGKTQFVITHHPFVTNGSHGKDRKAKNSCHQDIPCSIYQRMLNEIEPVLAAPQNRPLVCVAGHDHNLQIIKKKSGCKYQIVSGSISHVTPLIKKVPGTIYSVEATGFFRVDVLTDGRVYASAFHVNKSSKVTRDFTMQLQ